MERGGVGSSRAGGERASSGRKEEEGAAAMAAMRRSGRREEERRARLAEHVRVRRGARSAAAVDVAAAAALISCGVRRWWCSSGAGCRGGVRRDGDRKGVVGLGRVDGPDMSAKRACKRLVMLGYGVLTSG